jgi:hypothetical protein
VATRAIGGRISTFEWVLVARQVCLIGAIDQRASIFARRTLDSSAVLGGFHVRDKELAAPIGTWDLEGLIRKD